MAHATTDTAAARAALRAGEPVAFPTETVYGLGAPAHDDAAIARVFSLKGRPTDHPLIIHLHAADAMADWAADVPATAHALAARFWPGPLTLVLARRPDRGARAAGNRPTVALRVPAHPAALELLADLRALVAPSANRFGRPSPTLAQHVLDDFADTPLLVLDDGPTAYGIESTVVDLSMPAAPALLRPGALAQADIEAVTGALRVPAGVGGAPGTLAAHYAPRQRLVLLDSATFAAAATATRATKVAALGFDRPPWVADTRWRQLPGTPAAAASQLFALLRELERTDALLIAAQRPPAGPGWHAISDRLRRAAATG